MTNSFVHASEILKNLMAKRREIIQRATWGRWKLDRKHFCLEHAANADYYVPLDDFTCSAEILDWIFQLKQKRWVTDQDIADFLEATQDIFHPQANFCSFGVDRTSDPRKIADEFLSTKGAQRTP